jgi:hypothetical protein
VKALLKLPFIAHISFTHIISNFPKINTLFLSHSLKLIQILNPFIKLFYPCHLGLISDVSNVSQNNLVEVDILHRCLIFTWILLRGVQWLLEAFLVLHRVLLLLTVISLVHFGYYLIHFYLGIPSGLGDFGLVAKLLDIMHLFYL